MENKVPPKTGANAFQTGGKHYKKLAIEPWDYVAANGLGFFEGNVVRYVTRWRDKNGLEDLRKARDYIDKLIEVELAAPPAPAPLDLPAIDAGSSC